MVPSNAEWAKWVSESDSMGWLYTVRHSISGPSKTMTDPFVVAVVVVVVVPGAIKSIHLT